MTDGATSITADEGVDQEYLEGLRKAVSAMRTFLAKAEELDLALSNINFVHMNMCEFAPSEADLKRWNFEVADRPEPLLAPFDRDLVSLHLPLDGQADETHLYEAVWRTTASMERFHRLLDTAWYFNCEYARGKHRALDQRH